MNVIRFMLQNQTQVLELSLEHLWLVGVSTMLAMLIGIPVGDRDRAPATVEQACAGEREHHPDNSQSCALRISASRAVAGRARPIAWQFWRLLFTPCSPSFEIRTREFAASIRQW